MPSEGQYAVMVGNRNINAGLQSKIVEKTVTLTGAAGVGAVGTIDLFNVSGTVIVNLIAVCSASLVSAGGGTIEVGTTGLAGKTAALIAQTTATNIDEKEIWHDASPDSDIEPDSILVSNLVNEANIKATVGTGNITAGTIKFILTYTPISDLAGVVAA